jgi:hypothetical protein
VLTYITRITYQTLYLVRGQPKPHLVSFLHRYRQVARKPAKANLVFSAVCVHRNCTTAPSCTVQYVHRIFVMDFSQGPGERSLHIFTASDTNLPMIADALKSMIYIIQASQHIHATRSPSKGERMEVTHGKCEVCTELTLGRNIRV